MSRQRALSIANWAGVVPGRSQIVGAQPDSAAIPTPRLTKILIFIQVPFRYRNSLPAKVTSAAVHERGARKIP
jgi:hypothetical protein